MNYIFKDKGQINKEDDPINTTNNNTSILVI